MYFTYGEKELSYLRQRDVRLAAVIDQVGMIQREVDTDLFSSVVHHIIGQQISTKAQATIWQRMRDALGTVTAETILFADRFPFRYLADDYGLRYYAAFAGCSAETEASFETVSFLAKKVDELGLPCVLTIEGAQHRIAETIVQNTAGKNQKVLTMDSMQSTTSKGVANGTTYLSVMEKNLSVLKEALG